MRWSDIPRQPQPRTLRQFAGLWILFFGGLACRQYFFRHEPWSSAVLAAVALGVGLLGLVRPAAIRPIFVGWMIAVFPIGWVVSHVILAVVYFLIFTPIALVFRLIRRDALGLRRPADRATYWTEKPAAASARSYLRQF